MKTVGMITIGQSPRDDVVPEIEKLLGPEFRIVQAGALDGLTADAIASLAPGPGQFPLITRLLDGTSMVVAKEAVIPRLQTCLDRLADEASVFAVLCTGSFPRFRCARPVIEPDRILFALAQAVVNDAPLGVIVPIDGQVDPATARWGRIHPEVRVAVASPYGGAGPLLAASETLRAAGVGVVVMDCMGFPEAARDVVRDVTGAAVLLASRLLSRVVAEVA